MCPLHTRGLSHALIRPHTRHGHKRNGHPSRTHYATQLHTIHMLVHRGPLMNKPIRVIRRPAHKKVVRLPSTGRLPYFWALRRTFGFTGPNPPDKVKHHFNHIPYVTVGKTLLLWDVAEVYPNYDDPRYLVAPVYPCFGLQTLREWTEPLCWPTTDL
jgi:hypothetical protein